MAKPRSCGKVRASEGEALIGTVIVMAFVVGTLGVVAYALFELSPFAHHKERYHAPGRPQQSPRLD
jgi:hypothetical protein